MVGSEAQVGGGYLNTTIYDPLKCFLLKAYILALISELCSTAQSGKCGNMAEWLRREIRRIISLGFARVSSNLAVVDLFLLFFSEIYISYIGKARKNGMYF